jgi:hypothetical protein
MPADGTTRAEVLNAEMVAPTNETPDQLEPPPTFLETIQDMLPPVSPGASGLRDLFSDPDVAKDDLDDSDESFHYIPQDNPLSDQDVDDEDGSDESFHYIPPDQRSSSIPVASPSGKKSPRSSTGSDSEKTFHYPGADSPRSSPKTPCPPQHKGIQVDIKGKGKAKAM